MMTEFSGENSSKMKQLDLSCNMHFSRSNQLPMGKNFFSSWIFCFSLKYITLWRKTGFMVILLTLSNLSNVSFRNVWYVSVWVPELSPYQSISSFGSNPIPSLINLHLSVWQTPLSRAFKVNILSVCVFLRNQTHVLGFASATFNWLSYRNQK